MDRQTSILVVEDEQHIRRVLEYNLRLDGYEVYTAEDGPEALEIARQQKPDVILLDWMMPNMDGLDVLSELRHNEATRHIPVFMLTAKAIVADVERALSQGIDGYITKPFDPMQVGKAIREKLQKIHETRKCPKKVIDENASASSKRSW